jgi:SagB-type dehydrogenase family enzyme
VRFREAEPGLRRFDAPAEPIVLAAAEPADRLLARRSTRVFVQQPVALERCGRWLACLRRATVEGKPRYRYGSAGGLYPVQTYLVAKPGRIATLPAGAYYFDPAGCALAPLGAEPALERSDFGWVNQPTFDQAAFALFLIGELGAIAPMYGEASRDFCLIEAGLMTHLLEEEAIAQRIGLCQVGRCRVETLRRLLRLGPSQVFLHALLGGGLAVMSGDQSRVAARGEAPAAWEEGEL